MKKILLRCTALLLALVLAGCSGGGSPPTDHRQDSRDAGEADAIDQAQPREEPGKIRAVVGKNTGYVYHMLAVAECGYVNEYGAAYKALHPQEDLDTLKRHEELLTVAGGLHVGGLYFLCVSLPASLEDDISVTEYYEALAHLFGTGALEENFSIYQDIYEQSFSSVTDVSLESFREFYHYNQELKEELSEIMAVMSRGYDVYLDQVWADTLAELSPVAEELNREFMEQDYAAKWEALLGQEYRQEAFYAFLCASMENGPNCIDISGDKDVFYHSGEVASTAKLISHEFGIYMLMDALADTDAFAGFAYFGLTESLAEYYNTLVSGGHTDWDWGAEYIDFYRQLHESQPELTAEELFFHGVDHFMLGQ